MKKISRQFVYIAHLAYPVKTVNNAFWASSPAVIRQMQMITWLVSVLLVFTVYGRNGPGKSSAVEGWLLCSHNIWKYHWRSFSFFWSWLSEHFTEGHFHPPRLIRHHNAELLSSVWLKVTAWFQILSVVWWETARRPNVTRSCSFTITRTTPRLCAFNRERHGR